MGSQPLVRLREAEEEAALTDMRADLKQVCLRKGHERTAGYAHEEGVYHLSKNIWDAYQFGRIH